MTSVLLKDNYCHTSRWLPRGTQGFGNIMEYIADYGNVGEVPHRKVKRKRIHGYSAHTKTMWEAAEVSSTKPMWEAVSSTFARLEVEVSSTKSMWEAVSSTFARLEDDTSSKTMWEDETIIKIGFNLGTQRNTKLEFKSSIKTIFNLETEQNTKLEFKSSFKTIFNLETERNTKLGLRPFYLVADSTALGSLFHNVGEELVLVGFSLVDQDQGRQKWYRILDPYILLEELVTINCPL